MAQESLGYRSLQAIVLMRLRDGILRGDYAPGERLNINQLAKRYGVSPVPLREALRALEAEGLVAFAPNRGAVVKRFAADEVREAFLIRIPLECVAVREAVPRLSAADLAALDDLVEQMDHEADPVRWLQLNQDLHLTLYERAGLPRLHQIVTPLWAAVRPYLNIFVQREPDRSQDQIEHHALIDACRRRDVEGAVAITAQHLAKTRDVILTAFAEAPMATTAQARPARRRGGTGE